MAKIDVNQLKKGTAFIEDGVPYLVIKYDFTKLARGKANIKVKVRNLRSGAIVNKSYLSGNEVEDVELEKIKMQFLYSDESKAFFMNEKSFEQVGIDLKKVEDERRFLVEGESVWVLIWPKDDSREVLGVEVPASVELEVIEAEPGMKGDSGGNVTKMAVLTNEVKLQVPLFIEKGDRVRVNTESGEYIERVQSWG